MIARRLGAVGLALLLIVGAWTVRNRYIDETGDAPTDTSTSTDGTTAAAVIARDLICVADLAAVCATLDLSGTGLTLRTVDADDTVDGLSGPTDVSVAPLWITLDPLPGVVDETRRAARLPLLSYTEQPLATTPLVAVTTTALAAPLTTACGEPVVWRCLGDITGTPWSAVGGPGGTVRPGFPPPSGAIGQLSTTAAVAGYFDPAPVQSDDPAFSAWVRRLARAVRSGQLSGGTAVGTIQVRSSALDVAIGIAPELTPGNTSRFTIHAMSPGPDLHAVLAVPEGAEVPTGVAASVREALVASGWRASDDADSGIDARTVLVVRTLWEELS